MAGIFKAYDIRGIYGKTLNQDLAYQIGLAFANEMGQGKTMACGRDGRSHSKPLQTSLIHGLRDGGCHVVNMGLCTTPMTYFAGFTSGFDGSVMVTASHNPGDYNGFKFCREAAIPVGYADGLDRVEARVKQGRLRKADRPGTLREQDFKERYLDYLASKSHFKTPFRFAVDCGNGMGGFLAKDFFARTGQNPHALYWDLDFTFPNHLANPLDFKNLGVLCQKVVEDGLDFGVAFDGDADRCFFVDDRGQVVPADMTCALIASHYLETKGPSAIVYDVRSSRAVKEEIEKRNGDPILCRVGHSFMKARLREVDGWFGGELAGHFYFKEFSYADSAFLTMIKVMNIMDERELPLSQLIGPFQRYHPSGEINFQTENADALIEASKSRYPGGKVLEIDGVRVDFPEWWFSLRKSNTEPLLRMVVEAGTAEQLHDRVADLKRWILSSGARLHDG